MVVSEMRRWAQVAALGLVVTSLTVTAPAATADHDSKAYPHDRGWHLLHDNTRMAAGAACNVPINIRYRAHQREVRNGRPLTEANPPGKLKPGDHVLHQTAPGARVWLTNLRNHRTITLPADGDIATRVTRDGRSLVGKGRGANFFFGIGQRGVLWANGVQIISIPNAFRKDQKHVPVHPRRFASGRHFDLCARVGAKPVQGKVIPSPVPVHYRNCTIMTRDYARGVGRPGSTDKVRSGEARVTSFTVDRGVYHVNRNLDTDHDGIACEKAYALPPTASPTPLPPAASIPSPSPAPAAAPAPPPATAPAPAPAPIPTTGVASVSFDDGLINQYTVARPILLQNNIVATFYVVSDALVWGGDNMDATQVRQLVADGHEIGNHTRDHANLTTLSAAAIEAEFADAQSTIQSQIGVAPTTCAYPNGASNSSVHSIAARYFKGCRNTQGGFNTRDTPNYELVTLYMQQTTSAATVRQAADMAKANNSWLLLTYHGVESPNSTNVENVSATSFAAQMNALIASGIPVKTVTAAMTAMGK